MYYQFIRMMLAICWGMMAMLPCTAEAESASEEFALAANHYTQENWAAACGGFEQLIRRYPNSDQARDALFYLGEARVQQGDYQAAHDAFQQLLKSYPQHAQVSQAQFRLGETEYLLNNHVAAQRSLVQFVDQYPQHPLRGFACSYLGDLFLRNNQAEQALHHFEQALTLDPHAPLADECRLGMAKAYQQLGQNEDAIRFYRFLSVKPTSPLADDALLQVAAIHFEQSQFDQAIVHLQQLEQLHTGSPHLAEARYWLGRSFSQQQQWQSAQEAYTRLLAREDARASKWAPLAEYESGRVQIQLNQANKAAKHFQQVWQQWPDNPWADDALQHQLQLAYDQGRYKDIPPLASEFGRRYPNSPLIWHVQETLGRCYYVQQNYSRAIEVWKHLLSQQPNPQADEPSDYLNRRMTWQYLHGLALIGDAKYPRAIQVLSQIQPTADQSDLAAGIQMALSVAHIQQKDFVQAERAQQAYLKRLPNGPDAARCRADLAVSLAMNGKYGDADSALQDYLRRHPQHDLRCTTARSLAEQAYKDRQWTWATRWFAEMIRHADSPDLAAIGRSGLAWSHLDHGDLTAARQVFEEILAQHPNHSVASEAAYMQGQILQRQEQWNAALAQYQTVVRQFHQCQYAADALYAAGRIYQSDHSPHDLQAAQSKFAQLLDRFPDSDLVDDALYQLAWTHVDRNQPKQATDAFRRLHREHPDSPFWADATFRLAEGHLAAGRNDQADALLTQVVDAPDGAAVRDFAFYLRCQLAANQNRWQDAIGIADRLLDECPNSSLTLRTKLWRAEAYYRNDEFAVAETQFNQLRTQLTSQEEAWSALVDLRRAQILAQKEQWDAAYALARSVQDNHPQFRQMYEVDYLIGRYHSSLAQFKLARQAYERVVRSPAGGRTEAAAMAQWMIGEDYFHQEHYRQAIDAFHRVESLFAFPRWQSAALLEAAKAHEKLDQWSDAVRLYAQLLKRYPQTMFADQALQRLDQARKRLPANSQIR